MTNQSSPPILAIQNVLVSMDGHTEGFVDFRPYMPPEWREPFEAARDHGRAVFHDAEQYFARLVAAGFDFSFEIESESGFDPELYDLKLTPEERIARIDGDGVAAEFIIDGFGAITHDPALAHQTTLAFNRWFADTYLRVAPNGSTRRSWSISIAGVDTVVDEIADAHEHGIVAIHLPGNPATALPSCRTTTTTCTSRSGGPLMSGGCSPSSTPRSAARSRCGRWTSASAPTCRSR